LPRRELGDDEFVICFRELCNEQRTQGVFPFRGLEKCARGFRDQVCSAAGDCFFSAADRFLRNPLRGNLHAKWCGNMFHAYTRQCTGPSGSLCVCAAKRGSALPKPRPSKATTGPDTGKEETQLAHTFVAGNQWDRYSRGGPKVGGSRAVAFSRVGVGPLPHPFLPVWAVARKAGDHFVGGFSEGRPPKSGKNSLATRGNFPTAGGTGQGSAAVGMGERRSGPGGLPWHPGPSAAGTAIFSGVAKWPGPRW